MAAKKMHKNVCVLLAKEGHARTNGSHTHARLSGKVTFPQPNAKVHKIFLHTRSRSGDIPSVFPNWNWSRSSSSSKVLRMGSDIPTRKRICEEQGLRGQIVYTSHKHFLASHRCLFASV